MPHSFVINRRNRGEVKPSYDLWWGTPCLYICFSYVLMSSLGWFLMPLKEENFMRSKLWRKIHKFWHPLCKWEYHICETKQVRIQKLLKCLWREFRVEVNVDKSKVVFSCNIQGAAKQVLAHVIKMKEFDHYDKYLVLSTILDCSKKATFLVWRKGYEKSSRAQR